MKHPPPHGTYHNQIITWEQDIEARRLASLSRSGLEYWNAHTPTQRKEKCSHLHTPQVKAKARCKADAVYRSAEYRQAQAERMRLWHAKRWLERYMAAGGAAALLDDNKKSMK